MTRTPRTRISQATGRHARSVTSSSAVISAAVPTHFLVNTRRPGAKSIALKTTDVCAGLPATRAPFNGNPDEVVEVALGVTEARADGMGAEGRVERSKTIAKTRALDLFGAAGALRTNQHERTNGRSGKSSTALEVRDDHEQRLQIQKSNPRMATTREFS